MKRDLRIFIVTQMDPIYLISFFDELFHILEARNLKLNIELFDLPNFNESKIKLFKRLIKFYGFNDFLKLIFIYFKENFIKRRLQKFNNFLKKSKINYKQIASVNNIDFINYVKTNHPDIVVSVSAPEIFREKLLNIPNTQFVNIHCAPLPKYQGMMPNFWQKLNNENYSAITIHKISNKIDQGDILYQKKIDLLQTDCLHSNIIRGKKLSAIALLEFLFEEELKSNYFSIDNYFSFPTKKDVSKFRQSKKRFF